MIVKVQTSQMTTETTPQILVYNKDRSFNNQFGDAAMHAHIEGVAGPKSFWKAHINDEHKLELDELLEDQGW